jgi:hypothetical protein
MNGIVIHSIVFVMVGMVCATASDEKGIVAGFLDVAVCGEQESKCRKGGKLM